MMKPRSQTARDMRSLYLWAFFVRFSIGLFAWATIELTGVSLIEDAWYYEQVGAGVAADWMAGRQSIWLDNARESGTQAWVVVALIAGIYFLFGGLRVLPIVIAAYAAISAFTPVLTYRIGLEVGGDRRAALFAGRLVAFSPAFVFWGGALYKEGIIFLLLNLIVYHSLRLQYGFRARSIVVLVVSMGCLYGLRFYLAFIVAAAIMVALLFGKSKEARLGSSTLTAVRQIGLACLFVGALTAIGFGQRFTTVVPHSVGEVLQRVSISRQDLASTQSGYLSSVKSSTPHEAAAFLPIGVVYFLSVPLPWQIGRLRQNLTIPETLLWLCLYPFVAWGIWRTAQRNRQAAILLIVMSFGAVLIFALLVGNMGTAYRMRSQVWLLWAVFAGIGWSAWRAPRSIGIREPTTELMH